MDGEDRHPAEGVVHLLVGERGARLDLDSLQLDRGGVRRLEPTTSLTCGRIARGPKPLDTNGETTRSAPAASSRWSDPGLEARATMNSSGLSPCSDERDVRSSRPSPPRRPGRARAPRPLDAARARASRRRRRAARRRPASGSTRSSPRSTTEKWVVCSDSSSRATARPTRPYPQTMKWFSSLSMRRCIRFLLVDSPKCPRGPTAL